MYIYFGAVPVSGNISALLISLLIYRDSTSNPDKPTYDTVDLTSLSKFIQTCRLQWERLYIGIYNYLGFKGQGLDTV